LPSIGRVNRLQVVREVDFGLYLDGGDAERGGLGDILLPKRYVPKGCRIGDALDVFIYTDSEDRLIATTERPYAMVGEYALLKVASVTKHGIFLDWGLPKDLLLPFNEQETRMEAGKAYVVRLFLDADSRRIAASAKLDEFLFDEAHGEFSPGDAVSLFNAARTELGYRMIVNNSHWGLLHRHEQVRELKRGERLNGYIKQIREDGRIDLCLHRQPSGKSGEIGDAILAAMEAAGGFLPLTDKTGADEIRARFAVSKTLYKKAVGALYRQRRIRIGDDGIHALPPAPEEDAGEA
jgi:hypothetical protein